MVSDANLDFQTILNDLQYGLLIFDEVGRLVYENATACTLLGHDVETLCLKGWAAASVLFNARQTNPDDFIETVRGKALELRQPIRFYVSHSGESVSCWMTVFDHAPDTPYTVIMLEKPDWAAMSLLVGRFRDEMQEAVTSTQGHIALINNSLESGMDTDVQALKRRIGGFARLIEIHTHRAGRFLEMLERLEDVRLGRFREKVAARKQRLWMGDFLEDFIESLDEIMLVDPETEAYDHRARIIPRVYGNPVAVAPMAYVRRVLRDVLRNAIMYSMVAAPVRIEVGQRGRRVQIDVIDEGCGIRRRENDRVFAPFKRARQPQVIAEFGYGISLYICRYEVEAMNGRIWYESEEGVGTTFSIMLPAWDEETVSRSSSDTTTPA